jgi:hypothetical protein
LGGIYGIVSILVKVTDIWANFPNLKQNDNDRKRNLSVLTGVSFS